MQVRNRSGQGNGYRSNAMGMRGVAAASRISPDGSMRDQQVYNSERRSNRGGYLRGGSNSRPFHPPPHPPPHPQHHPPPHPPRENDIFMEAGRLAASYLVSKGVLPPHALPGNWRNNGLIMPHSDVRIPFDGGELVYSHSGNSSLGAGLVRRNYPDECNSMAFRNSARGRRRTGSFKNYESGSRRELVRSGPFPEKKIEAHFDDEQLVHNDSNGGRKSSSPGEITRQGDNEPRLESGIKESSSNGNCLASDADGETNKGSDDANEFHVESVEEERNGNNLEQHEEENKEVEDSAREDTLVGADNVDLLKESENVPTEVPIEEDNSARELSTGSEEQLSEFGCSNSVLTERGEKRVLDDDTDCREGSKRPKECVTSMDVQSDSCLPLSNSLENPTVLDEQITSELNISLSPKDHAESSELMQEKQLFPGSFKTYDLNLVGAFDVNENHNAASVLISQSVSETRKEATPIDVDLSMSYSFNLSKTNRKRGIKDADIEVIDLENDSGQEDQIFSSPQRRGDTVFTDLDGFPNNVNNPNEIPEVQDGYGLMISELLGNDSPNCSSVPNLNSLHNNISLPNEEGIPGDDDSIYMSLGEIPISFLSAWEQPTQDYGKPF